MSGEDQLIQIAIVSDDKKLAGALRALTGVCCASMGKLCRCALVSDLEAFAASLCPDMYAVVFSSFTGGEGDLFSLRKAAPRAARPLFPAQGRAARGRHPRIGRRRFRRQRLYDRGGGLFDRPRRVQPVRERVQARLPPRAAGA